MKHYTTILTTAVLASWGIWSLGSRASDPYRFNDLANRPEVAVGSSNRPSSFAPFLGGGQPLDFTLLQGVSPAHGRGERPVPVVARQKPREQSRGWIPVEISVYSSRYDGRRTASGEAYRHNTGHTAATTISHGRWALPKGSTWEVEYRGRRIIVRVNDVGSTRPHLARHWLDLSGRAWSDLTGRSGSRLRAKMRRVR
jgi:hypothetical protein